MDRRQPAVHRTIMVVDVERFGDRRRTNPHKVAVRAGLYAALREAFDHAQVPWNALDCQDCGDGMFILAPAHVPKALFVDVVPQAVALALREHNATHPAEERIRLRMALHAGEVTYDEHGVTATAVNVAFRLLDAPQVKAMLADSPGVLALITSGWFYDEVVRHSQSIDPATFRPVWVAVKETSMIGWISRPDHPYPPAVQTLASPPNKTAETVPHQLPAAPRSFAGRVKELSTLAAALETTAEAGRTVVISAIGGAGGIGKTWLALTWAHRNLHQFPDGQLFADLHGFSPTGQPAHPVDVLGGFLNALGIDRDRQPTDPERRADLYRSLIADKRMLIVLDNAATTDQVTPLLPGGPHCTVLITSRNHLHGLIVRHSAHPVHLDVLTDTEAHTLLTAALDSDHTAALVIAELITLCGGFPLALGLITARAAANPHLPLADIVTELRTLGLDALDSGDPPASLPTVLSWSLHHLTRQQRQVFALLGIAPGPDTGLPAAASLTGLTNREAHAVLRELADASLVHRTPGGRYAMHDLVRAYATTTANNLPGNVRETALRRVLDFYTHTAHAAAQLLYPDRDPVQLEPPSPGVQSHPLSDHPTALAWFDTEHACLLAAQRTASTLTWHRTVWLLASDLLPFHFYRGYLHDRLAVWQVAADAATHLPDPSTRTRIYLHVGLTHAELGHHDDAITHLNQTLALAERHRDPAHQAHTHYVLARTWDRQRDDQQTLNHARRALRLYRALDQLPAPETQILNAMGWCAARVGDYDTAREHCHTALNLYQHQHNPDGQAITLDNLGYIDHHSGHHTQAINRYHQALTLFRELNNTYDIADTLNAVGCPHVELGQTEHARTVWREALQLYRKQGRYDDATHVQHQLDNLRPTTP